MATRSNEPVLIMPCVEQGILAYPKPQRLVALNQRSQKQSGPTPVSGLTASLHCHNNSFGSSSEAELLEIIMRPSDGPSSVSYLGVSPPVRSGCFGGAANPWSHDRSWKMSAYSASSTNLQALRELDSEGESFLRTKDSAAARLVLGALDLPVADPADCSDAGSDATAVNECEPFTQCHTVYFLG